MKKQSFEQRFIVARVLNRHAAQHEFTALDEPVLAALEKWIEAAPQQNGYQASDPFPIASIRR